MADQRRSQAHGHGADREHSNDDPSGTRPRSTPQAALLVNTRTMSPVFTPPRPPAGKLLDRAPRAIADVLRAHGVPHEAIATEVGEMSGVRIAPTNDRQVVGVMNEFAFQGGAVRSNNQWVKPVTPSWGRGCRQCLTWVISVISAPSRHSAPSTEIAGSQARLGRSTRALAMSRERR